MVVIATAARTPSHGSQPKAEALHLARRDQVAQHDSGDAEETDLRERDHAAVGREEDHACSQDPEQKRVRQQVGHPELVDVREREDGGEDKHTRAERSCRDSPGAVRLIPAYRAAQRDAARAPRRATRR